MTRTVAAAAGLLLCLVSLAASPPASAQFAGAVCRTPIGTCIVPAIPRGSVCFCGSVQGIIP